MARNFPSLWRRESGRDLSSLQRDVDRLFNEFLSPFESATWEPELPASVVPPCSIEETDERYLISLDVPGLGKDDIRIELTERQLTISGERREEKKEEKANRYASERFYGRFVRSFTLPAMADPEKIQASYHEGVLDIVVPKSEAKKPRQIQVAEGKAAPRAEIPVKKEKAA